MKELHIEWQHLDVEKDGQSCTCVRCGDTGSAVADVVEALRQECVGVRIAYRETKLPPTDIARSNLVLINGRPIEDILDGAKASQSDCRSCGELVGAETQCRTVDVGGKSYEAIPVDLIRKAACAVAECC